MRTFFIRVGKNPIFRDSFWGLLGNILGKGLAFVGGILVARFLGKELYGEYGILRNTLLSISVFSTFGLGVTATKFVADYCNNKRKLVSDTISAALNITYLFSFLMAAVIFIFSSSLSLFLKAPHLDSYIKVLSIIIFFNAITTTQIGVLAGFMMFKSIAVNNILSGIVTFILSVFGVFFYEFDGAVIALLISQIFNCILNRLSLRKNKLYRPSIKVKVFLYRRLLSFSLPIVLQEGVYSLSNWVGVYLLVYFGTYGDVGINSAVCQWTNIVLFVPGVLRNVALSHFSSTINNLEGHNNVLNVLVKANFFATLLPMLVILVFNQYIVGFYGESFSGLNVVLCIALFGTIFNSVSSVYLYELVSRGRNWLSFFLRLFREVFVVLLSFVAFFSFSERYSTVILYNISFTISMILFFCILRGIVKNKKIV